MQGIRIEDIYKRHGLPPAFGCAWIYCIPCLAQSNPKSPQLEPFSSVLG
jgi:hypothetical protein